MKTKKVFLSVFLPVLILISPIKTMAWGAQGHQLVVDMALSLLSPQAKQKVLAILNSGTPTAPDDAAVFMDKVRGGVVPQYKFMDDWHFVNMEKNQTYAQVASKNDVVYNLQRMITFFNSKTNVSPDSLKLNLEILFHLMGDIAQPLHDGYGSDRGANFDLVTTPVFNMPNNNLHHVWDVIIIQEGKITLQTSLAYYHKLTPAAIAAINQGTTTSWMTQARTYLPQVYACKPVTHGTVTLTQAYLDSNVPIVQQQLVYAAVRLANVLQKSFGS